MSAYRLWLHYGPANAWGAQRPVLVWSQEEPKYDDGIPLDVTDDAYWRKRATSEPHEVT